MPKHKWMNKQYSGDPVVDQSDAFYKSNDLITDFMNNTPCKIPKIEEHYVSSLTDFDTIENLELPVHRLTGVVRRQYLQFIERLLETNYNSWIQKTGNHEDDSFTPIDLKKCAESIELKAVQSCMIVSLYRDFVLKIISEIKKETKEAILHPNLIDLKKVAPEKGRDVGVQTEIMAEEENISPSLQEKIKNFEKQFHLQDETPKKAIKKPVKKAKKRDKIRKDSLESTPALMTPISTKTDNFVRQNSDDDKIMAELEEMFQTDGENIFEACENRAQINAIINEIEKFDDKKVPSPQLLPSLPETPPTLTAAEKVQKPENDLKKSLWPCEFHMQKMRLREQLCFIAENNYFRYERIKSKFIILFGEYDEDEDELGPYSPSIELNEILVSSCRLRIAKWVVNSLMKPLQEGMIGNRFLFKKLAKHIADEIIYVNQYPDQKYIKSYVTDYFCTHSAILSLGDIS